MHRFLWWCALFVAIPLAAQEIAVSTPAFNTARSSALVVPNDDGFLTSWSGESGGVYASTLDLDGTLRRSAIPIAPTAYGPSSLAAGLNGSLVAYRAGSIVTTTFIDREGNAGATTGVVDVANTFATISAAGNASGFILLLARADVMQAYLFDTRGQLSAGPIEIGPTNGLPILSADRAGYVLFVERWNDQVITARRIDSTGALGAWNTLLTAQNGLPFVSAFFDGTRHVLMHEADRVLHRLFVAADGTPLGQPDGGVAVDAIMQKALPIGARTLVLLMEASTYELLLLDEKGQPEAKFVMPSSTSHSVTMAAVGTRALLATTRDLPGPLEYGSIMVGHLADVTTSVDVGPEIELARAAVSQSVLGVAASNGVVFALWYERSTNALLGGRVDPVTGAPLDGRGILINSGLVTQPAVVANGDGFLVAYLIINGGVSNLVIRRLSAAGQLLGEPATVSTTPQPFPPRLASNGTTALLVWTENSYDVVATRVSAGATVVDRPFLQVTGSDPGQKFAPDVAWNGENFLVAWQHQYAPAGQHGIVIELSAARVSLAGFVLDPPLRLGSLASPRVAANGGTFAVAGISGSVVRVVTVSAAGEVLSTVEASNSRYDTYDIEAWRDGFVVAWTDGTLGGRIRAATLEQGVVSAPFTPLASPMPASGPALVRLPDGLALAYSRGVADEGYGGAYRGFVTILSEARRRAVASR